MVSSVKLCCRVDKYAITVGLGIIEVIYNFGKHSFAGVIRDKNHMKFCSDGEQRNDTTA